MNHVATAPREQRSPFEGLLVRAVSGSGQTRNYGRLNEELCEDCSEVGVQHSHSRAGAKACTGLEEQAFLPMLYACPHPLRLASAVAA
jgi:hypothetical protein